jgi:hypothetical protein
MDVRKAGFDDSACKFASGAPEDDPLLLILNDRQADGLAWIVIREFTNREIALGPR